MYTNREPKDLNQMAEDGFVMFSDTAALYDCDQWTAFNIVMRDRPALKKRIGLYFYITMSELYKLTYGSTEWINLSREILDTYLSAIPAEDYGSAYCEMDEDAMS